MQGVVVRERSGGHGCPLQFKSEARNTKFETSINVQSTKVQNKKNMIIVLNFEHLNFMFVSDFDIRI
jgi:hypothetical protein